MIERYVFGNAEILKTLAARAHVKPYPHLRFRPKRPKAYEKTHYGSLVC